MKNENKKKNISMKALGLTLSAAFAVLLAGCGAQTSSQTESGSASDLTVAGKTTAGTLLLSVNPEIEIGYDEKGRVQAVEGVNDDGKAVVVGYTDFEGKTSTEVVNELVEKIYDGGYLADKINGNDKNIVVKLEEGSIHPEDDFLEKVADSVRQTVSENGMKSNTMVVNDQDLDNQGRIGTAKAQEIALAQMGLSEAAFASEKYDLDDGVYEMKFTANGVEYEYEIDAVTGKVLEADREHNDDWKQVDQDDDDDDDRVSAASRPAVDRDDDDDDDRVSAASRPAVDRDDDDDDDRVSAASRPAVDRDDDDDDDRVSAASRPAVDRDDDDDDDRVSAASRPAVDRDDDDDDDRVSAASRPAVDRDDDDNDNDNDNNDDDN